MIGNFISFVELGGIVLAWVIVWNYLIGAFTSHHSNSPASQGIAAVWQS